MATKSTNKTLWTVVLVAAFAFAMWKLLPVLSRKLSGGGSGGGSGVGGSGVPYYPQQGQQGQGQGGGGSLGLNPGQEPSGKGLGFLQGVNQGQLISDYNNYPFTPGTIGYDADVSQQGYDAINNDTIALQPLTNDTGILASFQNWFSTYFVPDDNSTGAIGPSSADASQYDQIQTISDDLSDQTIAQDDGSGDPYDDGSYDQALNDGGDDGSNGGGGDDSFNPVDGDNSGGY